MNKELEFLEEKYGHNSWNNYPPSKQQVAQWLKEYTEKQFAISGVGSSLPKVCKGCGTLSTKVIDKKYLACCPDNNYIPMEEYCKKAIYPDKQF